MTFLRDTATDTSGVLLQNHTPEVGGPWTKDTAAGANTDAAISNAGRIRGTANAAGEYWAGADSAADYDVTTVIWRRTNVGNAGPVFSHKVSARTFYTILYGPTVSQWQLYRCVNGAYSAVLASFTEATADSTTYTTVTTVRETATSVDITFSVGGVQKFTYSDTAANRITGGGRAGVRIHSGTTGSFDVRSWQVDSIESANVVTAISPASFSHSQAHGAAAVTVGTVTISMTAIAAALAIGAQTVTAAAPTQTISPAPVVTNQVVGSAAVQAGAASISPASVTTTQVVGASMVSPGTATIAPAGVATSQSFGGASLSPGTISVSPTSFPTSQAFGATVISAGTATISPASIVATKGFGTVAVGSHVTISPSSVVRTTSFGGATQVRHHAAFIDTSGATGTLYYRVVTVKNGVDSTPSNVLSVSVVGPQTISPISAVGAQAFGTSSVSAGAPSSTVSPSAITTPQAFGVNQIRHHGAFTDTAALSGTVHYRVVTVKNGVESSPSNVLSVSVTGPQTISPSGIVASQSVGSTVVQPGVHTVTAPSFTHAQVVGETVVSTGGALIAPPSVAHSQAMGATTVSLLVSTQSLSPLGVATTQAFGTSAISTGVVTITPASVIHGQAFGTLFIGIPPQSILPESIIGTLVVGFAHIRKRRPYPPPFRPEPKPAIPPLSPIGSGLVPSLGARAKVRPPLLS